MDGDDPSRGNETDALATSSDAAMRRSHETFYRVNRQLDAREQSLRDTDDTLRRTRELLGDVDVDLVALDREAVGPGDAAKRLLIVDDNATICDVLRLLFQFECPGVEIRTARGGRAALDEIPWAPDVVILDWQMPEMDGLETARALRRELGDVTIVMYSALPANRGEGPALAAGANRYVEKGADTSGLIDAVQTAFTGERRHLTR